MLNSIFSFFAGLVTFALDNIGIRFLASLGLGFATFAGLGSLVDSMVSTSQANFSSLPGDIFRVVSLLGVPDGLSLIASAYVARVALSVSPVLTRL